MIDYFLKFYTKKYKSKVKDLIEELSSFIEYKNIKESDNYLNIEFKQNLDENDWLIINYYYYYLDNLNKDTFLDKFRFNNKKIKKNKINFIDLFAGAGGLSQGFVNQGFEPILVNEIEKIFAETYYFNHHLQLDNYYIGDINNLLDSKEYINDILKDNNIDIVLGGPPCQSFSMANRQRVIDDPRNNLYKSYLKFLSITKPKFFVMENVKGMLNKADEIKEDFNNVLGDEYDVKFILLNARNFGVPQNRERIFFIGNRIGIKTEDIIDDIKVNIGKYKFNLNESISDLPTLKPNIVKNNSKNQNKDIGFNIIKYNYNKTEYCKWLNGNKNFNYLLNHKNRFNNDRDIEIFGKLPQGCNSTHESISDIMPYKHRNNIFKDKYYKLDYNNFSKTITSHMKFDCNMYIHPNQPRGLSPREAARIQTFPDDYYFRGTLGKWYAQIGNAVPVKLSEVIAETIKKYIK